MLRTFLSVWPSVFSENDSAPVLDRLQGEFGLGGLSIWVAGAPRFVVRPESSSARVSRTSGGLFAGCDELHFTATRIKPVLADGGEFRRNFERLCGQIRSRGMELRCLVAASSLGRAAERNPAMATKNLFGATSQRALCLLNPDTEAFFTALMHDLGARPEVGGVVLRDVNVSWQEAFDTELGAPVVLGESSRRLLSLCFCESCRQRAARDGVDADAACRSALTCVERFLDGFGAAEPPWDGVVAEHSPLSTWLDWQRGRLAEIVRRWREAFRGEFLVVADRPDSRAPIALGPDGAEPWTWIWPPEHYQNAGEKSAGEVSGECCIDLVARKSQWTQHIVALVAGVVEHGARCVTFEAPTFPNEAGLDAVRQAIRFARRTRDGA